MTPKCTEICLSINQRYSDEFPAKTKLNKLMFCVHCKFNKVYELIVEMDRMRFVANYAHSVSGK